MHQGLDKFNNHGFQVQQKRDRDFNRRFVLKGGVTTYLVSFVLWMDGRLLEKGHVLTSEWACLFWDTNGTYWNNALKYKWNLSKYTFAQTHNYNPSQLTASKPLFVLFLHFDMLILKAEYTCLPRPCDLETLFTHATSVSTKDHSWYTNTSFLTPSNSTKDWLLEHSTQQLVYTTQSR